jgi:hypothetical protein
MQEISEGVSIFAGEKARNIKGNALKEYTKRLYELGAITMIFTFADVGGSFSSIADISAGPPPIILLFSEFYMKGKNAEVLAKCAVMAKSVKFSVYAIGRTRDASGIHAKLLFNNTGTLVKSGLITIIKMQDCPKVSTHDYGTIAEKFATVTSVGLFKVMPFGFQDKLFIDCYCDYFHNELAKNRDLALSIKDVFLVIGSGTTLISLYNAFRMLGASVMFHCTIVGRTVDEIAIRAECPDMNVTFYYAPMRYHEVITPFAADEFGSEKLNGFIALCPHYDSKLLIGMNHYMLANRIPIYNLKNIMMLFVINI